MEPGPSGSRPRTTFTSEAVRSMVLASDDNELDICDTLLSDDSWDASSSSDECSSSNDDDSNPRRKGALPPVTSATRRMRGKGKGPMRGRGKGRGAKNVAAVTVTPRNPRSRSRSRSPRSRSRSPSSSPDRTESDSVIRWSESDQGATDNNYRFVRENTTGVNAELVTDSSSPLDCLFALFTPQIIDELLFNINEYARMLQRKNTPPLRYSVFQNFREVTKAELYRFMAVLIAMGLNPRDSIKSYWCITEPHLYTPWYGQMFSRTRFESIYHTFLHASGVDAMDQNKIEPFLESLMKSYQSAFYPAKELSIDEMVIGWKGRWKHKQYNATKPSKYHIKTFGLCDSQTGYVVNVFTYYGANTAYHPDLDPKCTQAIKVFQKLLTPVEKGHHIFGDRFYTSVALVDYLSSRGMYYTGTVDVRRKHFPAQLKTLRLDHLHMKWFMGQQGGDKKYLCVAFRDKKAKKNVCVVSSSSEVATELVKSKGGGLIHKPAMINAYNYNMNGCDRADQQVQYYGMHKRKSHKWWKKIFHWLLEITQINASIIYDKTRPRNESYRKLPLVKFKNLLIRQLTEAAVTAENLPPVVATRPLPPAVNWIAPGNHFAESGNADRNCRVCSKPGTGRKRTRNICVTCPGKPHLCKMPCFQLWHTRLNLD